MGLKRETTPELAPLEQHEKNLECEGINYRVVLEDGAKHFTNVSLFEINSLVCSLTKSMSREKLNVKRSGKCTTSRITSCQMSKLQQLKHCASYNQKNNKQRPA